MTAVSLFSPVPTPGKHSHLLTLLVTCWFVYEQKQKKNGIYDNTERSDTKPLNTESKGNTIKTDVYVLTYLKSNPREREIN